MAFWRRSEKNQRPFPVKILSACALKLALAAALPGALLSPDSSQAALERLNNKSYAVFLAAFNSSTGQAHGGVAGTAFFISPERAITAFHVLQVASFKPQNPQERIQIWLVHEGEAPIELAQDEITEHPEQDQTLIHLKVGKRAPDRHVFSLAKSEMKGPFKTEGFAANTAGPILESAGNQLRIKSVPSLDRVNRQGALAAETRITLTSNDVNLREIPCLQLTYSPRLGLSGGPVIGKDGKVVAMNSFADPRDRATTWAVALSSKVAEKN